MTADAVTLYLPSIDGFEREEATTPENQMETIMPFYDNEPILGDSDEEIVALAPIPFWFCRDVKQKPWE